MRMDPMAICEGLKGIAIKISATQRGCASYSSLIFIMKVTQVPFLVHVLRQVGDLRLTSGSQ